MLRLLLLSALVGTAFAAASWTEMLDQQSTAAPTYTPTATPTMTPTAPVTAEPTNSGNYQSQVKSAAPTTLDPTHNPTKTPTATPTHSPTVSPTLRPTTLNPTMDPTIVPTPEPTDTPTPAPTYTPSHFGVEINSKNDDGISAHGCNCAGCDSHYTIADPMAFGILVHDETIARGGFDIAKGHDSGALAHISAAQNTLARLDPFTGCKMACEAHTSSSDAIGVRDNELNHPGSSGGCKVALFNEASMQCFLYMKGVSSMAEDNQAPGVFSTLDVVNDLGADPVTHHLDADSGNYFSNYTHNLPSSYLYPHPSMYLPCVKSPIKVKCDGSSCEVQWMAGQDPAHEQYGYEKVEWVNAPPANTECTNSYVVSVSDDKVGGVVTLEAPTECGGGNDWTFKNPAKYSCWAKSEDCKSNANCS